MAATTGTANPWSVGDVFVGIGDGKNAFGAYRGFTPDGIRKSDPDVLDAVGGYSTGCAVDPTVANGDLFTTSFTPTVSVIPNLLPHSPATSFNLAPADKGGNYLPTALPRAAGVDPLPAAIVNASIESIGVDREGNLYLGAQIQPTDVYTWQGYGWIIEMSKPTATTPATLLGWWQVDAGTQQDPTHTVLQGVHGVDWLDLSNDETTIYYTSEDQYIRSFYVNGPNKGQQGPAIPIHRPDGSTIGNRAFALRLLPPGDSSSGFLVATDGGVLRLDSTGKVVTLYFDQGVTGYFAMNITPDGQSLWTATTAGALYKFHIASGAKLGPFATGAPTSLGLCVKREYTASQNVCFASDPAGYPIPSATDPSGYVTVACKTPPTPEYCQAHPTDPSCLPPGTPSLSLPSTPVVNNDGDQVSLQLQATDPWNQGLTWTLTGLPSGMDASFNATALTVSTTGLISGRLKWHDSDYSPYTVHVTVRNSHGQSASGSFSWVVNHVNAPPTLKYGGGPLVAIDGTPLNVPISAGDLDSDALVLSASYTRYTDSTFAIPAAPAQPGLPFGMTLPAGGVLYPPAYALQLAGTPQVTGPPFQQYFRLTITACDCAATDWDHNSADLSQLHHVSVSVNVTVVDNPPTFTASDQQSLLGVPVMYTAIRDSLGDPDGASSLPLSVTITAGSLPPALVLSADGSISGTPSTAGAYILTVRATDRFGAFTEQTIHWTVYVNHPPDCSKAVASIAEIWPPNHQMVAVNVLGVTDADGDRIAIAIDRILQDEPTNTTGDGNTIADASGLGTSTAWVRAERAGTPSVPGNGRVYEIQFTAKDPKLGTCHASVVTGVPHDMRSGHQVIDDGVRYDSVTGALVPPQQVALRRPPG